MLHGRHDSSKVRNPEILTEVTHVKVHSTRKYVFPWRCGVQSCSPKHTLKSRRCSQGCTEICVAVERQVIKAGCSRTHGDQESLGGSRLPQHTLKMQCMASGVVQESTGKKGYKEATTCEWTHLVGSIFFGRDLFLTTLRAHDETTLQPHALTTC